MKKIKREKIELTQEELHDLWNGVYYKTNEYDLKGEIYKQVDKINTSDMSDGPSWDYIIQRKSDNKFFMFHIWEAGEHNGYIFEGEHIIEVFEKQTVTYELN